MGKDILTDEEWRRRLTPEEYRVLRRKATEAAFTGRYWKEGGDGLYCCAGCGAPLFDAAAKYDSGSGWPSFWAPVEPDHVVTVADTSHGLRRTEVRCATCASHLGHVFDDGPEPTGLRFCINSVALSLVPTDSVAPAPGAQDGRRP